MIVLNISEEYGYAHWYAVLTNERYEELKKEWQTIRGLNCLVPVRFLIPEASSFPLRPEHAQFAEDEYLKANKIQVISVHVHQSDDSYLGDLGWTIPDQNMFEFKGVKYTEEQVTALFDKYRAEDIADYEMRKEEIEAPWQPDGFGPIDMIYDWPDDTPLPTGWVRTSEGTIVRDSSNGNH